MAVAKPSPSRSRRPPLWLSATALTAAITVAFGLARWVEHFAADPYAEDFRVSYEAAEIGLSDGWSHIYDLDLQRQKSAGFGPDGSVISSDHNFVAPAPVAWLTAPLTPLPLPVAYLVWTIGSLAALFGAWWLVCPGKGLGRITLLLIALALYPTHYSFLLGQPLMLSIACLALAWWFLERERWWPTGLAMAAALFVKPQLLVLLPVALLVSGRWRPVSYCALAGGILGILCLVALGPHGLAAYANDLTFTNSNPVHSALTFGSLVGRGPMATVLEVTAGVGALALAFYRRERTDLVFALGIVGSTASAFYLHEYDPAVLMLPVWIVLRSRPSLPQRAWLLLGVPAAQFIALGLPIPMLLWEAGWIGKLGIEPWLARRVPPPGARQQTLFMVDKRT